MSPLRKRMIRELQLQRKSPKTVQAYVTAVAQLAAHYGRSPVDISLEEVRDYVHWLIVERKLASSSCNQKLNGIRFFYAKVLQQPIDLRVPMKRSGRLPEPLSRREVACLLAAVRNVKHRTLLMTAYRAKYLDGLKTLWQQGRLDLPPDLSSLDDRGRDRWIRRLRKHSWVVYSKAPFAGPEKLLDYLSRYTHRVAISNNRIKSCDNGEVTFSYRDRQDGDRRKTETLPADEFITRFLRHVLPDRFTRIRHYGFLASRNKKKALAQICQLLGATTPTLEPAQTSQQWLQDVLGIDPARSPCCGNPLIDDLLLPVHGPLSTATTLPPVPCSARPPP